MAPPPSARYQRLRHYIAKRMRMSHVVQPLKLMELLGRRSPAPAQDVARLILGEDGTHNAIPPNASSGWRARFTFNGITRYDQGAYGLVGSAQGRESGALLPAPGSWRPCRAITRISGPSSRKYTA
jgi:hypothetical protein